MRGNRLLFAIGLAIVCTWPIARARGAPPQRVQWIAVAAPGLMDEARVLADHRRENDDEVRLLNVTEILSPEQIRDADAKPLRTRIRELCSAWDGPTCIVLIG